MNRFLCAKRFGYRLFLLGLSGWLVACGTITVAEESPTPTPVKLVAVAGEPSSTPGGVSDNRVVIGMSAAFSGPSQALGIELYRGSMAYLEPLNRQGGVKGRQIIIRAYDDGYNPEPTINNTIALIEQDEVFLLFNYVGTPTVTRILPLLKRYDHRFITLFFPFSGAQPQREEPYDQFVFNLRVSYRQETAGLTNKLIAIGRQRIAVFYQIDAYGRSGWDGVKRALARHHFDIVESATYSRGDNFAASFQDQVDILRAPNPDAVIVVGTYQAAAGFVRDARDSGWQIPIVNLSVVGSENFLEMLLAAGQQTGRDYTTNLIISQAVPSYEDLTIPAVREYREAMERYGAKLPPNLPVTNYQPLAYSFVSFEGYLNAKLVVEMLRRMENDPKRVYIVPTMEAMSRVDLGLPSLISFGPANHQGLDTVYYTTIKDGRFVPLTDWKEWAK